MPTDWDRPRPDDVFIGELASVLALTREPAPPAVRPIRWRTADGDTLYLHEMATSHVRNAVAKILRSRDHWRNGYLEWFKIEMACRAWDLACANLRLDPIIDPPDGHEVLTEFDQRYQDLIGDVLLNHEGIDHRYRQPSNTTFDAQRFRQFIDAEIQRIIMGIPSRPED